MPVDDEQETLHLIAELHERGCSLREICAELTALGRRTKRGGRWAAALGVTTTPEVDHQRVVKVLDEFYAHAAFESLPVPFVTFYEDVSADHVARSTEGSVADAVGKSIANPKVFPGFDTLKSGYLDPGVDRVSRTPVQDACERFPQSRILAINVTDSPSYYAHDLPCPVLEVRVALPEISPDAMKGEGAEFDLAVEAGAEATARALAR